MGDLSGRQLGQYRLEAVIGRGSTATVYRAHQQSLGRYVAVKVLQPSLDPHFISRFRREAQAIAQLSHPNILPIYDYGEEDGRTYFVTQLIPGGANLGHLQTGAPMEAAPALTLAGYILDALGYAHGRGIVHRDIKPANILLPAPAWPLLADFGIAKLATETTQLTPPGTLVGTAAYIAPERALNRQADARSDLYSVAVVLYELLTGRLPFEGPTPAVVLRGHVYEQPPRPRDLNPAIPPAVERALLRALEKDPAARYEDAGAMSAALAAAGRAGRGGRAAPTPAPIPPLDPYRTLQLPERDDAPPRANPAPRGPGVALALALIALLALGAALWATGGQSGAAAERPPGPSQQRGSPVASAGGGPPLAESATLPPTTPLAPPTETPFVAPTAPPLPSAPPAPPTEAPQPAPPAPARSLLLDDEAWSGGYGGAGAPRSYGGRSATWIYGRGTGYDTMRATFSVAGQPAGTATLTVEGMDSEGRTRTLIAVAVNGVVVFEGPNPLPDDDIPLESGTWAAATWAFDAALLRPGPNEISITNLSEGGFSLPPFLMLDYAELRVGG